MNRLCPKILSIIINDLGRYFHVPEIIPPVPVDVQGKGVPSDHNGVSAVPISSSKSQRKCEARKIEVRPLPESLILKFGEVIANEKWEFLSPEMSSTDLVDAYENYTLNLLSDVFPLKTVTISDKDKPYFTEELRKLRRQRQRLYCKDERSPQYEIAKTKFDKNLKTEAKNISRRLRLKF